MKCKSRDNTCDIFKIFYQFILSVFFLNFFLKRRIFSKKIIYTLVFRNFHIISKLLFSILKSNRFLKSIQKEIAERLFAYSLPYSTIFIDCFPFSTAARKSSWSSREAWKRLFESNRVRWRGSPASRILACTNLIRNFIVARSRINLHFFDQLFRIS